MALKDVQDIYYPVLDKGWVRLVDCMGGDDDIVEAARTSYRKSKKTTDRNLLRYLYRNRHTSPFEMVELKFHCKMPIFVARQWVRHRTACLAGSTMLQFDLPGGKTRRGNQLYQKSVADLFRSFQPTVNARPDKQRNPYFKRDRTKGMLLRCLDEASGEVLSTHITDIWESGEKPTYRVALANGATAVMSADHRCFTAAGWLTLKEICPGLAYSGDGTALPKMAYVGAGMNHVPVGFNEVNASTEQWCAVLGFEGLYEVSDQGRVRRIAKERGAPPNKAVKTASVTPSRHAVVSLSRSGRSRAFLVHRLVLEAFVGKAPNGLQCRHLNGNGLDNRLVNLAWDTVQHNADDRVRDKATTALSRTWQSIVQIAPAGVQMTYDLSVEGPWHNFSADGLIVHNSLNEASGRYVEMPQEFYTPTPETICVQSTDNKQGRGEQVGEYKALQFLVDLQGQRQLVSRNYKDALGNQVAKELARIDLPLSIYTQWYWKIDLHNLLNFLTLRYDGHAQWEIRQYAEVIGGVLQQLVPEAIQAWIDYRARAVQLSRMDRLLLQKQLGGQVPTLEDAQLIGMTDREFKEYQDKLTPPEPLAFRLPEPISTPEG